ncbi:hypothetical protein KIN20_016200 [Parelaphostrongylus tenuis]|uniref:Uncharacterized protein n=1 Tax=Parelaphostrongylus tenuis TaxID=148309 RepID=A0AAD5QT16_PARTN|nr:hypothetical protein KIN20_016200 [Parelaphostrongylus tenuis]
MRASVVQRLANAPGKSEIWVRIPADANVFAQHSTLLDKTLSGAVGVYSMTEAIIRKELLHTNGKDKGDWSGNLLLGKYRVRLFKTADVPLLANGSFLLNHPRIVVIDMLAAEMSEKKVKGEKEIADHRLATPQIRGFLLMDHSNLISFHSPNWNNGVRRMMKAFVNVR